MTIEIGRHVAGRYEILSQIAAGGMGEVYRARDFRLDRTVALKVLPPSAVATPESLARFEREVRALASLNHPNILTIHDFGKDGELWYAVMEHLEGETLRAHLARARMGWEKAALIALRIAEGLEAAHTKGIIHRDLKPENIFLRGDDSVRILDFGLARIEPPPDKRPDKITIEESTTTKAGVILGTIPYMSPEQARGQALDARSDLFSLGVILYEMVAAQGPFARGTTADTIAAILLEEPPDPNTLGIEMPPPLTQVLKGCLQKRAELRYQSAREVIAPLRTITTATTPLPAPAPTRTPSGRSGAKSVAVLPFVNEGGDPGTEYLGDGIAESLINTLALLPRLRVMARSASFRFRGPQVDPLAAARQLGVRTLVAGRVALRETSLTIDVELMDAATGYRLWGGHYSRTISDLLSIQDEIAGEISAKLRVRVSGEERNRLLRRWTRDNAAYQDYLQGRYYWNKRSEEGILRAIEYFGRAIAQDPEYATAYVGMADAHNIRGYWNLVHPGSAFPAARAAALRALEIEPKLAEAHASLAYATFFHNWDWSGAERSFRSALRLNDSYSTAHHFYSAFLSAMGRFEEAVQESRRAQELDPLSLIISAASGVPYYYAHRFDEAVERYRRTLELDPHFGPAYIWLGRALNAMELHEEAVVAHEAALALTGRDPSVIALLAHSRARAGHRSAAEEALEELTRLRELSYVSALDIALLHVGRGDATAALEWIARALDDRAPAVVFLPLDPMFAPIAGDPRFAPLTQRLALPATRPSVRHQVPT
ncbi:MAG: protein kinase [Acidobacteria bacterium]|nr:protein kinase [Acidobacteriota bacterium]